MADAVELEQDVKLQRDSADLIADLKSSLKPFLWKTTTSGELRIRRRVKLGDLDRFIHILDQFQELPQLLDPHLDNLVSLLANSFLEYLRSPPPKHPSPHPEQLVPVYKAICKLLYGFCKVRGDKVIVGFLSTETRHLELLLSAIEIGTSPSKVEPQSTKSEEDPALEANWQWEETYITLLWLSQLLLAPFDLATISSGSPEDTSTGISGLEFSREIPNIAYRVISLAIRFLSSSGKERDAAKVLLVRLAMRKDMQDLGVMNALCSRALAKFSMTRGCPSTFESLGTLSFIAGLIVSSTGTTNMDPYLSAIFMVAQRVSDVENKHYKPIHTSPVARKIIIKILRTISVILLQQLSSMSSSEMIETTIGHMLDSLTDQATPVRLAASKALSIITLKLPPDMASQVVDEVLAAFEKNLMFKVKSGETTKSRDLSRVSRFEWHGLTLTLSHLIFRRSIPPENISPILRALRLALSFEQQSTSGSAVGSNVRDAACFGIWALARRYTTRELEALKLEPDVFSELSGESEGSALQILATELVVAASLDPEGNIRRGCSAALQELIGRHPDTIAEGIKVVQVVDYHAVALRSRAVEEVAIEAAQLSQYYYKSILKGLLGWRGVCDPNAATRRVAARTIGKLSAIPELTWRDPAPLKEVWNTVELIVRRVTLLTLRDNEQRHGLILSFAAVLQNLSHEFTRVKIQDEFTSILLHFPKDRVALATNTASNDADNDMAVEDGHPLFKIIESESSYYFLIRAILQKIHTTLCVVREIFQEVRQPQLIADAASHLIASYWWILRTDCIFRDFDARRARHIYELTKSQDKGEDFHSALQIAMNHEKDTNLIQLLEQGPYSSWPNNINDSVFVEGSFLPDVSITKESRNLVDQFLQLGDADTVDIVSQAAVDLASLLERNQTSEWVESWKMYGLAVRVPARKEMGRTYLHALFKLPIYAENFMPDGMFGRMPDDFREEVIQAVHARWNAPTPVSDVELKVVILRCLTSSLILRQIPSAFASILESALNDYTTTARGDVGSLVRVEAAKAVAVIWDSKDFVEAEYTSDVSISSVLFPHIMRIASEKLDRVRSEGKKALLKLDLIELIAKPTIIQEVKMPDSFYDASLSDSSKEYFRYLFDLMTKWWPGQKCPVKSWGPEFMAGFVTSADTGSEDLVRASRAALIEFCTLSYVHAMWVAETLSLTLSLNMKNDRVLIPTLEIVAFLLDMKLIPTDIENFNVAKEIFPSLQTVLRRTKNVRKLEAVIKCMGGMIDIWNDGTKEVFNISPLKHLEGFLLHRFPRIKDCAADEIFIRTGKGKGVDWEKAGKDEVKGLGL